MHYTRWWKYGDPLTLKRPQRIDPEALCAVPGCTENVTSREHCGKHYSRLKNAGDPLVELKRREKGTGSITVNGYLVVTNGDTREGLHRIILREAIGDGEHPCHWCGKIVNWKESWPRSLTGLVVDHLDHDKLNNELDNLAPSCGGCNLARTRT